MTINVWCDNKEVPVNMVEFSDGALTFKLDKVPDNPKYISVFVCPTTPVYRVREEVELVVDALMFGKEVCTFEGTKFILGLPYLPYGRADRRFEKGNPLPLSNFLCWLRDELDFFDEILVNDVHNPKYVLEDFIGLPFTHKTQVECFKQSLPKGFNGNYDFVIAPDKGAIHKAQTIADHLKIGIGFCEKERDVSTGVIVKSKLPEMDLKGKSVIIPDDLCDGGYTFIKLAEQLKQAGASQVDLYVTHMIGSKGLDSFKGLIDNIYCYHTVGKYLNKQNIADFNNQ